MEPASPGRGRDELLTVRDAAQAVALLQPQRLRLLEALDEPDSAAGLARRLGLTRQQVNYHVRELERAGLVELVEERRRGNCVERVMVAVARRFVISPAVLGALDVGIEDVRSHFSPTSLAAAAARTIRELGELQSRAAGETGGVATMVLESEVRFATVEARNAFAKEFSDAVAHLVVKHHDASADGDLSFRIMVGAYPVRGRRSDPGAGGSATDEGPPLDSA